MKLALFFHLVIHIIKEIGTYCQRFLKHPKLQGVEVKIYPNWSNLVQGKPNNIQASSRTMYLKKKHFKNTPWHCHHSKISWRELSVKFNLSNKKGAIPPNGGQVLAEFAKTLGVNVHQFNPEQRLSGRDYIQRVRRARHKLYKKVSIPTLRPTKHLQSAIQ